MFYIDTKFRSWIRKDIALGHIGPTLIVFLAFMGLTTWSALSSQKDIEDKKAQVLTRNIQEKKLNIESRLNSYENILRASKGLFGASDKVTRAEWKQFIGSFEIDKRYVGIQAVGYAEAIKKPDLQSHIQSVRQTDLKDYNVYPAGDRPLYVSLLYSESTNPDKDPRKNNIGLDLYTDEIRRSAMDLSRDSGEASITDIAKPLRPNSQNFDSTLIIYLPIYEGGVTPSSVEQRREKLSGFVFSGFFAANLLNTNQTQNDNFGFAVYDGREADHSLIYQSSSFDKISSGNKAKSNTVSIMAKDQQWEIVGKVSPGVVSDKELSRPISIFWGGALFSLFVAGFIYLLLLNRFRVTFDQEQREIQDAKDELLALASHQLRTPATGVKQYLGLLRDGYAGKLSREQKKYINEANLNNERQLETINEMLFVARANANNITLSLELFDINALAKSTAESIKELAKENDQKLIIKLPARKTLITADKRYLRMALENLLTNAANYTPKQGTISLTLKKSKQEVIIVIADTGVGIDKDDYELLFRKFSRIPNELTSKVSGSGIGLYLVKKVVDSHKGNIEFESEAGQGTTFIIKLPLKQEIPAKTLARNKS